MSKAKVETDNKNKLEPLITIAKEVLSKRGNELKQAFSENKKVINGKKMYAPLGNKYDSDIIITSIILKYIAYPSDYCGLTKTSTDSEIFSITNAFSTVLLSEEKVFFQDINSPEEETKINIYGNGFKEVKQKRVNVFELNDFINVVDNNPISTDDTSQQSL